MTLHGIFRPLCKKWRMSQTIVRYFDSLPRENCTDEQREVVRYLRNHPATIFPYDFCDGYRPQDIRVFRDPSNGLSYIEQDHKRLYVKRSWNGSKIQRKYNALLLEQDPQSPHRYLTPSFGVSEGDVLVDVGAAEGNFALSVIEKVKRMYLIEADEEWIEALEATFAPWRDKVVIVHKFVSDRDDDQFMTLNALLKTDPEINFVKIDVDGAERELLAGADRLLQDKRPLKLALCTYHQQGDEQEFYALLKQKGFSLEYSGGFMLFFYNRQKLVPPFFRRGLIRAIKF